MERDIKGQENKCLCDNCGYVDGFVFYISTLDCELCEDCCGYGGEEE